MSYEFKMPEVGEGVTKGVVGKLLVKPGDRVTKDQLVIEVETDKALVEVPVDRAGVVESIPVKSGDEVPIGGTLLILADEAGAAAAAPQPAAPAAEAAPAAASSGMNGSAAAPQPAAPVAAAKNRVELSTAPAPSGNGGSELIPAGPATRRLARELNIDLARIPGTGPKGRITKEDVMAFAGNGGAAAPATTSVPAYQPASAAAAFEPAAVSLPDFTRWGEVEREAVNMVRRRTAEHMALSWSVIPHVTQFEDADITELEAFRARHKEAAAERGAKLTPTVFALKAVLSALKRYPQFNCSFDMAAGEIIHKKYYNIGIATETERGLLVPVIHNAERMDIYELAAELSELSGRAREGRLTLEEMQGGTFTISNQGGIGGGHFTPIVNHPEVAIMAIGRSREEPRFINGQLKARIICPIAVSYDHRVIDGAMAARFIDALKTSLEDPEKLLMGL